MWTEERLGDNLVLLLREMKASLKRQRLGNYFVSKENLFDSLPRHKLAHAHERFHRLQENPVPYLMVAIKRLHCDRGFYPLVDIDRWAVSSVTILMLETAFFVFLCVPGCTTS